MVMNGAISEKQAQGSGEDEGHFVRHLSSAEYAAVISMILASLYLMLSSFFPLLYNLTSTFDPIDFIKNLFYFIIGIGTLSGVSFLLRKETYLQHIADETFERVIYHRLEPVLMDVAQVQVGLNGVQTQLDRLNRNVELLSKKETAAPAVAHQTTYHIKYIVLINLTLAVFLFMLQYPLGYVPYAVTLVYILWWGAITVEYKLWKEDAAWGWVFVPVLVLPVYTITMNAYLQSYMLFASLFVGLGLYAFSYYSWCNYIIRGVMPFDIQEAVRSAQEKIEAAKKIPEMTLKKPEIAINFKLPSRIQMGWIMILLAMALFLITWTGYALQHGIIPNISWDMIGLKDFAWQASYTYALNLIGLLLILSGLKFIKITQT
jgi:hypothetical protein